MTRTEIVALLSGPLEAAGLGVPVAWPNVGSDSSSPRIDVDWSDPDRSDITVALDAPMERGRLILTAVVGESEDDGDANGNALADALAALYPAGLRLMGSETLVTLNQPAIIRAGYRDGPEWRVGVVIPYLATPL